MQGVVVLTDRRQLLPGRGLVEVVTAAVDGGATYVVLREKDLPAPERSSLAHAMADALGELVLQHLVIASDVALAAAVGAAGVHLAASDPWAYEQQLLVGERRLVVGRSCHTQSELRDAEAGGADYATASPVFPTKSKPGYGPPLGTDGLAHLCRSVPRLPVFALGGVGPSRVVPCLAAGCAGVAVMGEVMGADDPAQLVAQLMSEASRYPAS